MFSGSCLLRLGSILLSLGLETAYRVWLIQKPLGALLWPRPNT